MHVPQSWFSGLIWISLVTVGLAALYLLVILIKESKDGELW